MKILRLASAIASAALLTLLIAGAAAATPPSGGDLPQTLPARAASAWLVSQFNTEGFIPTAPGSVHADLSSTSQAVLALSAANYDLSLAKAAVSYLELHVNAYVTVGGADGPGQLAILIFDAEAVGVNPESFGTTDLVSRLLATQQTSGPDEGAFGTETQLTDEYTGTYDQGLALAALAAAGTRGTSQTESAVDWLIAQQCPNGGWTLPDIADDSCSASPASFEGPDTNSTSLAVEGLAAQDALTSSVSSSALEFFSNTEQSDGGWGYTPDATATPTDPDSTSMVIQGLLAMGVSPTSASFSKGSANPVSTLLSFQFTSGTSAGAFYYPPAPAPANSLSTEQAVPALEALSFPWGTSGRGYREAASDGGLFSFGNSSYLGSMRGLRLNAPVVGVASTPDGNGYWEVASDGGVFSFGDARYFGSEAGHKLNAPVVGIASTPDGNGYWLVAADGGVFGFGDASYFGSMGGRALAKPVVGMASTPDGNGYWLVAADGGIFNFGDASYFGSMGGRALAKPVVGMAAGLGRTL
ncbi:MAG: hypothetical protein WAM97_01745 [Acidimicrobiales bacterium]